MTATPSRLPDFPASVEFLDRPQLAVETALRGQIVVVLFWRVGCVHSRQALATLAELARERQRRPFAVLAIHVAVADAERDTERVRRASAGFRDAVTFAVDSERELSRSIGVTSLPWVLLVDGDGDVRSGGRGEPNRMRLAEAIDGLLDVQDEEGGAASIALMPPQPNSGIGDGPTAIASDGEHLWVAAQGCVFAITPAGDVVREFDDFVQPVAITVAGHQVLVSDCGVHELRSIDRDSDEVTTVLGTGFRGTDRYGGGFGDQQPLSSPGGGCSHEGAVYLAHSGAHQIWQFDPETQAASAWVGTGQRSQADGGDGATFAEPLGIACTDDEIFVADGGNDALRAIEMAHNTVRTVARDLGRPAAVLVHGAAVWVAASWQPAVVRMSLAGDDPQVICDGSQGLVEPVAMAFHGDELWVADAGAAAIFAIDVDATPAVVRRVEPDWPARPAVTAGARIAVAIDVLEFSDVTLRVHLPCEPGEQLDRGARCEVDLMDECDPVLAAARQATVDIDGEHAVVLVPIDERGNGVLRVRARATVLVGAESRPQPREFCYIVAATVGPEGALEAEVRAI